MPIRDPILLNLLEKVRAHLSKNNSNCICLLIYKGKINKLGKILGCALLYWKNSIISGLLHTTLWGDRLYDHSFIRPLHQVVL